MTFAYEGTWDLVPELSHYDEGQLPATGRYVITRNGEDISFDIHWTDGKGEAHEVSFTGRPDGAVRPAGPDGMQASFHAKGTLELESRAYQAGQVVSYAFRRASRSGDLLSVVQVYNRPDGTRSSRFQIYRRAGVDIS